MSSTPIKFMSRDYIIHPKHLQRIHRPRISDQDNQILDQDEINKLNSDKSTVNSSRYLDTAHSKIRKPWSPVNDRYYKVDSSDEDNDKDSREEDNNQEDHRPIVRIFPITPPPSIEVAAQAQILEG